MGSEAKAILGTVGQCWRYPVKSFQGMPMDQLTVDVGGVSGDRYRALIDNESKRVMSAKRTAKLLEAIADDRQIQLPDGTTIDYDDPEISQVLSDWLGRQVTLCTTEDIPELGVTELSYEMTFDPPNDDAEYYDIPVPSGSFLDLAPLHIMTTATLRACEEYRSDLDWDIRRFRPNLLVEVDSAFVEDSWVGKPIRAGSLVFEVTQPTVRCAMPLRHQPTLGDGYPPLEREPELFRAMNEIRPEWANHLGVYVNVVEPGVVKPGDTLELLEV